MKQYKEHLSKDFLASIVVFLVALPLCMGIAIASGVPVMYGLISGIIGGLVVGAFTGAPIQVSGPAAGLAVMVYEFVNSYGLKALVPMGIIVGIVQMATAYFKFGHYFRATSPALIKGLLSGIGLLIFSSQFHIMLDDSTKSNGIENLTTIPHAIGHIFADLQSSIIPYAGLLGLITIMIIVMWGASNLKITRIMPAPLIAVISASFIANFYQFPIKFVEIPTDIMGTLFTSNHFAGFKEINFKFILEALAMAFVASAETLLCVTAVDKMSRSKASDYNQEILAQGIGNTVAGLLGALPVTGVIVRSAANYESGGKTKMSPIFHGIWLLGIVVFFPQVLKLVPMSVLAAILVFTGFRLLDLKSLPSIYRKGKSEFAVYLLTVGIIVSVDLFTGVIAGFLLSICLLVVKLLKVDVDFDIDNDTHTIAFKGRISFLNIPQLAHKLDGFKPERTNVVVDLENVEFHDHAVEEHIDHWKEQVESQGHKVELKKS